MLFARLQTFKFDFVVTSTEWDQFFGQMALNIMESLKTIYLMEEADMSSQTDRGTMGPLQLGAPKGTGTWRGRTESDGCSATKEAAHSKMVQFLYKRTRSQMSLHAHRFRPLSQSALARTSFLRTRSSQSTTSTARRSAAAERAAPALPCRPDIARSAARRGRCAGAWCLPARSSATCRCGTRGSSAATSP